MGPKKNVDSCPVSRTRRNKRSDDQDDQQEVDDKDEQIRLLQEQLEDAQASITTLTEANDMLSFYAIR